jgi:hypothetical protein
VGSSAGTSKSHASEWEALTAFGYARISRVKPIVIISWYLQTWLAVFLGQPIADILVKKTKR